MWHVLLRSGAPVCFACFQREGRVFQVLVHRCNGLVRWNVKKCAFMQRLARVRSSVPHLEAANRYSVFFPRLIEIAKPSFISQRLVSHFAMWCLCRYASMPPQAPCGSGCFTQTQRYASAGPAVQGLAVWLLAMDVHHNWYMANNHGLDVYKIYIRI